jgi:D-alanyl-lipoteichoic acid acyltransferase DltB (MBOAT superfamily)
VAYFPQLVAGPINRAKDLLPQIVRPRARSFEGTSRGLYLILFGLFKKIAIRRRRRRNGGAGLRRS